MNPVEYPKVEAFKGLNNRIDPIRLGLEWQLQANNCLCDDAGFLIRRPGQIVSKNAGYKDIYGTRDGRLLVIDSSDQMIQIDNSGEIQVLHTNITGAPFQWAELGYAIFLLGNGFNWAVTKEEAIPWGSLCPAISAASYPMGDPISYPPPTGNLISVLRSQIAIAVWEPELDRSTLFLSLLDYPHEFRLEKDYLLFPGQITLLADTDDDLVIGTGRSIFLLHFDGTLTKVADYGVPITIGTYDEYGVVWFWTDRGLCKAAPFENITDKQLAITERDFVTGALLSWQGSKYAIMQQTGNEFYQRKAQPYEVVSIFSPSLVNLIWPERTLSATGIEV